MPYSAATQKAIDAEQSILSETGPTRAVVMPDYGRLRDQTRACNK